MVGSVLLVPAPGATSKTLSRREAADLLAGLAAAVVLIVGIVTIVGDSDVLAPESKTTTTKEAVAETAGATKTTTTTTAPTPARGKRAAAAGSKTTTVERTGPTAAKPPETTTTVEQGERTFTERVLGDGGIVVLQIAAVLFAAFVAAAAVQRVILGQYGFKFGNFELANVADDAAAGIAGLTKKVDALQGDTATALEALDKAHRDDNANVKEDLALAYKRMALIEDRIGN